MEGSRTRLQRRLHRWPYEVGRVFYPGGGDPALLIVQSGSGSIITGDRLVQRISVGRDAAATVVGQGALSVHRARDGRGSGEDLALRAEPGSWLENLAEPRVLFDAADFEQSTVIDVDDDGVVLSLESTFVHPEARAGRYGSSLRIRRGGELIAREISSLDLADLGGVRRAHRAFAVLVVAGADATAIDGVVPLVARAAMDVGAYAAASMLPFDAGFAVRVAAGDGRAVRAVLDGALPAIRSHRRPRV